MLAANVITSEPRTSNAQRWGNHQNPVNFAESIFQVSLDQNLMNHQTLYALFVLVGAGTVFPWYGYGFSLLQVLLRPLGQATLNHDIMLSQMIF